MHLADRPESALLPGRHNTTASVWFLLLKEWNVRLRRIAHTSDRTQHQSRLFELTEPSHRGLSAAPFREPCSSPFQRLSFASSFNLSKNARCLWPEARSTASRVASRL